MPKKKLLRASQHFCEICWSMTTNHTAKLPVPVLSRCEAGDRWGIIIQLNYPSYTRHLKKETTQNKKKGPISKGRGKKKAASAKKQKRRDKKDKTTKNSTRLSNIIPKWKSKNKHTTSRHPNRFISYTKHAALHQPCRSLVQPPHPRTGRHPTQICRSGLTPITSSADDDLHQHRLDCSTTVQQKNTTKSFRGLFLVVRALIFPQDHTSTTTAR